MARAPRKRRQSRPAAPPAELSDDEFNAALSRQVAPVIAMAEEIRRSAERAVLPPFHQPPPVREPPAVAPFVEALAEAMGKHPETREPEAREPAARRKPTGVVSPKTAAAAVAIAVYLFMVGRPAKSGARELARRAADYAMMVGLSGAEALDPEYPAMRDLAKLVLAGLATAQRSED